MPWWRHISLMSPSSIAVSPVALDTTPNQTKKLLQQWWMPLLAFSLLCLFMWLTPPRSPILHARTPLETVAHNLGHAINSVWVGISLILLIIPSLFSSLVKKQVNPWAWRALDAILLDFLL